MDMDEGEKEVTPELLRVWTRIDRMVDERLKQREGMQGGRRAERKFSPKGGK